MKLSKLLSATAITCGLLTSVPIQAKSIGLVGMYQLNAENNQKDIIKNIQINTAKVGCQLQRDGKVIDNKGNYALKTINQFFVLVCDSEILASSVSKPWLTQLKQETENLALLEGEFAFINENSFTQSGIKRSYILKLSEFNNYDPVARHNDLDKLGNMVKSMDNRFTNESVIRVNEAYGMKRLDEVTVIYYDTPEAGMKFRQNNEDVLEQVGAFNLTHLTGFSYLFASSNI